MTPEPCHALEPHASELVKSPDKSEQGLWGYWGRQFRRQAAVSAAATGALGTVARLVLQLGALLVVVSTIAGVTVWVAMLQNLGVNVFDYVGTSELPALGLRFLPAAEITATIFILLGFTSVAAAWMAAHAVESHREAFEKVRDKGVWDKIVAWAGAARANAAGYLLPLPAALAFVITSSSLVKVMVDKGVQHYQSPSACVHHVMWTKDAWVGDPPFAESQCAALVGVFGQSTVLLVEGFVYTVPNAKIASTKLRAGHLFGPPAHH
jgi:hypothetical protein